MFLYGEWKSLWSVLFAHVFRTIFSNERNKAFNHTFRHSSQKMKTRCDWFFTRLSIVSKFSSIYFQWFSIKLWPYAWLAWRCFSTFCKKEEKYLSIFSMHTKCRLKTHNPRCNNFTYLPIFLPSKPNSWLAWTYKSLHSKVRYCSLHILYILPSKCNNGRKCAKL